MGRVTFERDSDLEVPTDPKHPKGAVLRSDRMELTEVRFNAGAGADTHAHPEEQTFLVIQGHLRVWLGDGPPYDVTAGECSHHPSNVPHRVLAVEDTVALSFKDIVDPTYAATGDLG